MTRPDFPPLMTGRQTTDAPLDAAIKAARQGVDAGLICWRLERQAGQHLQAALVLVPDNAAPATSAPSASDQPARALPAGALPARALPACAVALRDAMGGLIPSEIGITFGWSGKIRANGAQTGTISLHAPDDTAWIIVLLCLTFALPDGPEPGHCPQQTALDQEGCADLSPMDLLSAWARHSLRHLNRLDTPHGQADLARDWRGLIDDIASGQAIGLDDDMGLVLDAGTAPIPLSTLINRV